MTGWSRVRITDGRRIGVATMERAKTWGTRARSRGAAFPAGDVSGFRFGLEAEYLLVESDTFRPLWHRDLNFADVNTALEGIPTGDLPPSDGLALDRPHRRRMPYYVEGYHVPDPDAPGVELWPKGIEIRTPAVRSIEEAVDLLGELYARSQQALTEIGYRTVAISYHPMESHFEGPRGNRDFDRWQWAQEAMLTYGPDVNVSLPPGLAERLDHADLSAKVNAYAPALVALSLASPLFQGGPWRIDGRVGKSVRTHRRSVHARAWRYHPGQSGRLEFKAFEMTNRLDDFHAFLLLWLAVLLDDGLEDRAGDAARIDDLLAVAREGLEVAHVRARAAEVLDRARIVLADRGFDPRPLEPMSRRLTTRWLPADEMLALYESEGTITGVIRHLATLVPAVGSETGSIPVLAS